MKFNIISTKLKDKYAGLHSIITVNSNGCLANTIIQTSNSLLTYNNSNVIIRDNTFFKSTKRINNIVLNNSIINIEADSTQSSTQYNHILFNNSHIGFSSISYNSNFLELYSGCTIPITKNDKNGYKINYNFVWSSNLAFNYDTNTIEWQKYNNNTVFVNEINELNISISGQNEETILSDDYNIAYNIFYKNNLINGFYKVAKFTLNDIIKREATIKNFSLSNNKNKYQLIIPSFHEISCDEITIMNIQSFYSNGLKINKLVVDNSYIKINNSTNISLSSNNSIIQLDQQLLNYESIQNTHIITNKPKLTYYPRYENTSEYLAGFSMVENPSGKLLYTTEIFNIEQQKLQYISSFIDSTINGLSDYSLIKVLQKITENDSDKVFLSGIYKELKNNNYLFKIGSFFIEIYESCNLKTFLTYDTYPQNGNIIENLQTITNTKRNNNYKYGLQSHTHKMYNHINSSTPRGTLFPLLSINNHKWLNNSNGKLLKQTTGVSYSQPSASFKGMLIPQRTIIPIGSILNFYQVYDSLTNTWLPKIPHGYYRIESTGGKTIQVDIDDSTIDSFNGQYAKMFESRLTNDKTISAFIGSNPSNNKKVPLKYNNIQNNAADTVRLIKIIKYAEGKKDK